MAVKGALAKELIIKKLAETFGEDWIGEVDKKYYVWSKENGERVQIAITLTCPKVMVDTGAVSAAASEENWDFSDTPEKKENVEISDKEKETIKLLMDQLGL